MGLDRLAEVRHGINPEDLFGPEQVKGPVEEAASDAFGASRNLLTAALMYANLSGAPAIRRDLVEAADETYGQLRSLLLQDVQDEEGRSHLERPHILSQKGIADAVTTSLLSLGNVIGWRKTRTLAEFADIFLSAGVAAQTVDAHVTVERLHRDLVRSVETSKPVRPESDEFDAQRRRFEREVLGLPPKRQEGYEPIIVAYGEVVPSFVERVADDPEFGFPQTPATMTDLATHASTLILGATETSQNPFNPGALEQVAEGLVVVSRGLITPESPASARHVVRATRELPIKTQ